MKRLPPWCREDLRKALASAITIVALGAAGIGPGLAQSTTNPPSAASTPAGTPQSSLLSASGSVDKAAIERYVRHLYAWPSPIKVQVADPKPSGISGLWRVDVTASAGTQSQSETFLVSADGTRLVRGQVYDLGANPYAADAAKIRTTGEPAIGPESAPVTIVMFSDFQCSFCREEATILSTNLQKNFAGKVRLVYRDYPLEQIHPWARSASIAGRCLLRQSNDAFWGFHDWIFAKQAEVTEENFKKLLIEQAKVKGWDIDKLTGCYDLRVTEPEVDRSIAEARALGLYSTPTLFINGRKLVGRLEWPNLKQVIEHELEYAAGEPGRGTPAAPKG
jgi:protein-disulfide isomerase